MITVSSGVLLDALASVRRISDKAATALLQSVLVDVKPGTLTLTGTNTALGIRVTINSTSSLSDAGSFLISPVTLANAVKASGGSEVTIERDDRKATVRCGKAKYTINITDTAQYPGIPESIGVKSCVVNIGSAALADVMRRVWPCIDKSDQRKGGETRGVFIEREGDGIRFVTCDGSSLAYVDVAVTPDGDVPDTVIPLVAADAIVKEIGKVDEPAVLRLGSSALTFEMSGTVLYARVMEGPFVPYRSILPAPTGNVITTTTENMAGALRAMMPIADTLAGVSAGVTFTMHANSVVLTSRAVDVGSGDISVDVEYAGADMVKGFNASIMLPVLNAIPADNITVDMGSSPLAPTVIRGDEGGGYWLVMPYRVVG